MVGVKVCKKAVLGLAAAAWMATMSLAPTSVASAQTGAWGVEQSGVTLPLASDWSHEHAPLTVGLNLGVASLVDPDGALDPKGEAGLASRGAGDVYVDGEGVVQASLSVPTSSAIERIPPPLWRQAAPTPVRQDAAPPATGETAAPVRPEPAPPPMGAPTAEPSRPAEAAAIVESRAEAAPIAPQPTVAQPPIAEPPIQPRPIQSAGAQTVTAPSSPVRAPPASTPNREAAPAAAARPRDSYVLGPLDRIKLIVFQEPDLSGEFVIQASGSVALPLLREIRAQGLTAPELESAIMQAFVERNLLNDPKVAIEILSARPFFILGEVQKPGEYPYQTGLSALNAIATAGGFTPLADQTTVMIKRVGAATWEPQPLDGGLQIAPGDTLRVEKGAFYILGEVQKAGEYPYSPGMSVLRAVATAQGWTPRAERGRVLITRRGETQQRDVQLRPDAPINPGDTIVVLERWF